jgi:shikimate kinase
MRGRRVSAAASDVVDVVNPIPDPANRAIGVGEGSSDQMRGETREQVSLTHRRGSVKLSCVVTTGSDLRNDLAGPRSVVLITGMSGTGKSCVLAELARRGHRVLDTDDPGWIVESQTLSATEPLWDLEKIGAVLERHRAGWLFIAGCVANQGVLYDCFDAVVLLSAPVDVILARVTDRANPFGSTSADRAKIVDDLAAYEPLLRAGADHEIVTTAPIGDVVAALEQVAGSARQANR